MVIENICTKKTYEKDGQTKNVWLQVGTMRTTDEGKRFIELNHLPNITFYVFEQKKKESTTDAWLEDK